jgi:hypothetical protein
LAEKDKEVAEESVWWLQTLILNVHLDRVCKTMGSIQGRKTLVCEQSACIDDLYDDLTTMYGAEVDGGYSAIGQIDANNPGSVTVLANGASLGPHFINYNTLKECLCGMGVSIMEILSELDGDEGGTGRDELKSLLKCIAVLAPTTMEGLRILSAERSAENGPAA